MFRKFFVPGVLSLACLLMATDFAAAQRRGGYRGGSQSGYRGGSYNGYRNGYYNGYRNGSWNGWWGGVGVYVAPSYPYRSGYYSPDYYGSTPSYYYTPAPATEYVQPATVVTSQANIRVLVPNPQARVWFDGQMTAQSGTDRLFQTPALTNAGTYRIRASWMENGQERTQERVVTVSPGQSVIVDFNR